MKQRTSFTTRCLALVLALMLLVSAADLGLTLPVSAAAEDTFSLNEGEIVAKNYALSDAEKALIGSGLLVGEVKTFSYPTDADAQAGLVMVDIDTKTVTVKDYKDDTVSGETWVPVSAKLVVGSTEVETLELTKKNDVYTDTYVYDGAAFSVEVSYEVKAVETKVPTTTQTELLRAAKFLKEGMEELDLASDISGNLNYYTLANDTLVQLASDDGIVVGEYMGQKLALKLQSADAIASVKALNEQIKNGDLDYVTMVDAYYIASNKTKYILDNYNELEALAAETHNHVNNVMKDQVFQTLGNPDNDLTQKLMEKDAGMYKAVSNLIKYTNQWVTQMESVVAPTSWPNGETASFVKTGLTNEEYSKLNTLVLALPAADDLSPIPTLLNELTVETKTVKLNMSMFDVSVKVVWNKYDAETDAPKQHIAETDPDVITVPKDTAKADVMDKIDADKDTVADFAEEKVAEWTLELPEFADHFTASVTKDLPDTITADTTYEVVYNPNKYTVSGNVDEINGDYYYTETVVLPKYTGDDGKVYDYTVAGEYKAEGTEIEITGNVEINRELGEARTNSTLYDEVVTGSELKPVEESILASSAVTAGKGQEPKDNISIRYPSDAHVTLNETTGEVTAMVVKSDYPNKDWNWEPKNIEITTGGVVETKAMTKNGDKYTYTVDGDTYESIKVLYELRLEGVDAGTLKNLPYQLVSETNSQLSAMDSLAGIRSDLADVNETVMEILVDCAEDGSETKEALTALLGCYEDKTLKICKYLNEYAALEGKRADQLIYYYNNQEIMAEQLEVIVTALDAVNTDPEFKDAVRAEFATGSLAEQVEKAFTLLDEISGDIGKIQLPAINKYIDLSADATVLKGLAEKLVTAKLDTDVTKYNSADLVLVYGIQKNAPNRATVTLTLSVKGGKPTSFNYTVVKDTEKLNSSAVTAKFNETRDAILGAGNEQYYTVQFTQNGTVISGLEAILNATFAENTEYVVEWTAVPVPIKGEDENGNEIDFGTVSIIDSERYITLPEHKTAGMEYEYTVNGDTYEQGTAINAWELHLGGTLTITRKEVNVAEQAKQERLNKFKTAMNKVSDKSVALDMVFSNNDEDLTMAIDIAAETNEIMNGIMNFAQELTNQPYDIYLKGNPLYVNGKIYLQTLIDALLKDEGFNNDDFSDALRNDEPIISGEMDLMVPVKTFALRAMPGADDTLNFSIKKVGEKEMLTKAANAIEAIKPYVDFAGGADGVDVKINLPEKVYEVYLTALLAVGEVDLDDMNKVNTWIAIEFLKDYIDTILKDDTINAKTWDNTLKLLDKEAGDRLPNYDLAQYDKYYQAIRKVYTQWATVTESGADSHAKIAFSVPTKTAVDKVVAKGEIEIPSVLLKQIYEYANEIDLTGNVHVTLTNTSVDFEAVVADEDVLKENAKDLVGDAKAVKNGAASAKAVAKGTLKSWIKGEGLANGIDYTTDLSKRLSEMTGGAVVVLLKDINDTLTFDGTTVLDLNGKTVANVQANGHLYIFDSKLANGQGGVTGNVSGNVSITAGKYENCDVTSFLPDGYEVDANGVVTNELYDIVEKSVDELVFEINSDIIPNNDIDSYTAFAKAVGAEIALDVVMNSYPYAMLYANGNKIFDTKNVDDMDDLMGLIAAPGTAGKAVNMLLDCTSLPGLAEFINEVSADLLDFAAIETALRNNEEVASYEIVTAPWKLVIDRNDQLDCITGGLIANEDEEHKRKLTLKFVGSNNADAAEFFGFLDDIVNKAEFKLVNVKDIEFANKFFNIEGGAEVVFDADLSDYTTYMAIVVANALENPAKQAMADAVNNGDMDALKAEFDKLTPKNIADALKVLNRGDDFAKLAQDAGISGNFTLTGKKAYLEKAIMWTLSAAGRALEELEVTGTSKKTLGGLETTYGTYGFDKAYSRFADADWKGYGVNFNLTTSKADVKVKLFEIDDCMWGDVNHDDVVDVLDATLVCEYVVRNGNLDVFFCTKRADVNADGVIDVVDATLICEYIVNPGMTSFPAESL